MNRYENPTPRAALGLTAVAMAAITVMTLVVLPAEFGSVSANADTLAAQKERPEAPPQVATAAAEISVPGVFDPEDGVSPGRMAFETQECGRQHRSRSLSLTD